MLAVVILLAMYLIAAALQPGDLRVERSITISAPSALAFGQINDLRKWQEISPYAKDDPAAKYTFSGAAAGIGSSLERVGNAKIGAGPYYYYRQPAQRAGAPQI
jgi:hypothetical protein